MASECNCGSARLTRSNRGRRYAYTVSGLVDRRDDPNPAPGPARVQVDGIGFDPLDERQMEDTIAAAYLAGRGGTVVFVNVDVAVRMRRDPSLLAMVEAADLVLADGMPLVWASRLAKMPLPERVAGSTMLGRLSSRCAREGIPVMVMGGQPGSAQSAADSLTTASPGLRVGWHTPPFGFENDPAARAGIDGALDRFGRCLCFVGLGFPRQERLMSVLRESRPDWWFIASGGGIDFLARGDRAATWMQKSGLEWLHRLGREPRRLARRYLIDDIPFATRMLASSALRGWSASGPGGQSQLE